METEPATVLSNQRLSPGRDIRLTIYAIIRNWKLTDRGSESGKHNAIARCIAAISGDEQLSRQRIHQLVIRVHWMLRPYMRWSDEI